MKGTQCKLACELVSREPSWLARKQSIRHSRRDPRRAHVAGEFVAHRTLSYGGGDVALCSEKDVLNNPSNVESAIVDFPPQGRSPVAEVERQRHEEEDVEAEVAPQPPAESRKPRASAGWAEAVDLVPKLLTHALPPRRPSPTLTELDTMIAEAEDDRDFYRGFLERAEAAGLGLRRGQRLLRQAEGRIAQLGRKRTVLLGRDGHGQTK
jgi:hypothetical protein